MNYQERIVVYLDVLGFKYLIDGTTNVNGDENPEGVKKILRIYELIHQNWDMPSISDDPAKSSAKLSLAKENAERGKIVTVFSDSIVISFPQTVEGEIFWTIMEIRLLLLELANLGIFCRGAVSVGKLFHDQKVVFGPALVEAYLLESKEAVYPRILIAQSVFDIAEQPFARIHDATEELQFIQGLLNKDDDGYYYIDFLEKVQGEIDDPEFGYCDYLMTVGQHIKLGLENLEQKIKEKYEWLQNKYNLTLQGVLSEEVTTKLLDQGRQDMVDYYGILKPI